MMQINLDSFEQNGLKLDKLELLEGFKNFNKQFSSGLESFKGAYGITEISKGEGLLETIQKSVDGNGYDKNYFVNGKLDCTRQVRRVNELFNDTKRYICTLKYDDIGNAYTKEIVKFGKNGLNSIELNLIPSTKVVKDNFSSIIDEYGRPISNKITDLKVKTVDESRKYLSDKLRDGSYLENDERGHLIADSLGGTNTKENIVAQAFNTNRKDMVRLENYVKALKAEHPDSKIDYEIKTNYAGTGKRPTSFEPTITIDGKKVQFEGEYSDLSKIYNVKSGEVTALKKLEANIGEKFGMQHEAGMREGLGAATITFAVSTIDNFESYMDGEISAEEMVKGIAKNTGTAGLIGYGSGFVKSSISQAMSNSSQAMIKNLSKSGVPAAIVSFGVTSYDSVADFAQGKIDATELAYDLGDNVASIAGASAASFVGKSVGAKVGIAIGTVAAGPAGGAAGAAIGSVAGSVVGSMAGTVIASEAYATAVEKGSVGAELLANKAQELASTTVERAKVEIPDQVESIKSSINDYAKQWNIPIKV